MLHRIGQIDLVRVEARAVQRLPEQSSSGSDERLAGEIFLIARLLADQHETGASWA